MPTCCDCGLSYPKDVFSKSQLKKKPDQRRCLGCAAEAEEAEAQAGGTSATNATNANTGAADAAGASASGAFEEGMGYRIIDEEDIGYCVTDETIQMVKHLHHSGRMTDEQNQTILRRFLQLLSFSPEEEAQLVAKWRPYALTLPHRVSLRGLKSRPDLNGREGVATSWVAESQRYQVRLTGPRSKPLSIKPDNVRPIGNRAGLVGRCWDASEWHNGLLMCDGRIPVRGEVSLIMEGPYPKRSPDEEEYQRTVDREAMACVFTYRGKMHLLKSPALGGTSMLSQWKEYDIDRSYQVQRAFVVGDEQDRLVVLAGDKNEVGTYMFAALYDFPDMNLVKRWSGDDGEEFESQIREGDCYEDTVALLFESREIRRFGPRDDHKLCCYNYNDSEAPYLNQVIEWTLPEEIARGDGRISDLTVSAGRVGAKVVTLSFNGLVRIWQTDSPAGCVALLNRPMPTDEPYSNWGTVRRLPDAMRRGRLDDGSVITCHNDTLSVWSTPMTSCPERIMAIRNPRVSNRITGFTVDQEFLDSPCISIGGILTNYADEGEFDATQLALWSPRKDGCIVGFEIPSEVGMPHSSVRLCGGRPLMASGQGDVRSSDSRSGSEGHHKFGDETCYVYVVSAREDDYIEDRKMGIEPASPPGILADLISTDGQEYAPKGLNVHISLQNFPVVPGQVLAKPRDVRPCVTMCHGCGRISTLEELSACTGCSGCALYCSRSCQKRSWPLHKPFCKATQHLKEWLQTRMQG